LKLNRLIIALTVIIVILTLFLRGYFRVQMAAQEINEAKKELLETAQMRYEPLDSIIAYYNRTFNGKSQFIKRMDSALAEFKKNGQISAIPVIENSIYNLKNFLDSVEGEDERLDTLRLLVYRVVKYDTPMKEAIERYNAAVESLSTKTSSALYTPFKKFIIKRKPILIKIEYQTEEGQVLPVETEAREIKEHILSTIVEEVIDTLLTDSLKEDTLKKEGGESDKSDTAGIPTPREGEGGDSGEEGDRTP